jgi:hypothetical protein
MKLQSHSLASAIRSGKPVDRLAPLVADNVAKLFDADMQESVGKLCMAIIIQESGADPDHYLGDTSLPGGPSVGPMQVYFKSARDYGLIAPDETAEEYAQRASDESWGVFAGVTVFSRKLREAGGNLDRAVSRYNGDTTGQYAQSVFSHKGELYG